MNHISLVHDASQKVSCDICNKVLNSMNSLDYHKLYAHTDDRPFPCGYCSFEFKSDKARQMHISRVHTESAGLKCNFCGKILKNLRSLKEHKKQHENDPTIPCKKCDKLFCTKVQLMDHVKAHHRKFGCLLCKHIQVKRPRVVMHVEKKHAEVLGWGKTAIDFIEMIETD